MAKLLKLRRGTTSQHSSFTGAEGEVTVDTNKDTLVVHDGSTAGGHPVAAEDMANVSSASIAGRLGTDSIATSKIAAGALPTDVTVTNGNVVSNAAIAGTKISPDFGSQNIATTGVIGVGDTATITGIAPAVVFTETNGDPDFRIQGNAGVLRFHDMTNGVERLTINADGHVDVAGNLDVGSGVDVTGNITVSGTVDGRDVAADGTKLDGIESGATADQTGAQIASALSGENISGLGNVGINAELSARKGVFTDDGSNSPTVSISTDDQSPWALQIKNDTYWNSTSNGLRIYQDNSGNMYNTVTGNGAFINHFFQTINGGTTNNCLRFDTSRAVHLYHQNATRLSTTSAGIDITGSIVVSGTVDGRDVASDGSKLDGIATGANNITNNNQLTNGAGYITSASFSNIAGGGTFTGDVTFSGGGNAVAISANSDIRFANGTWSGDHTKIQHHNNSLYLQGGSGTYGHVFRDHAGTDRWSILADGHFYPMANNTYDIGSSGQRVRNIYTNDLHLSNEGHSNDVDNTWGDWTIQEGESDLFLKNNRSGKNYKFNLTEVS